MYFTFFKEKCLFLIKKQCMIVTERMYIDLDYFTSIFCLLCCVYWLSICCYINGSFYFAYFSREGPVQDGYDSANSWSDSRDRNYTRDSSQTVPGTQEVTLHGVVGTMLHKLVSIWLKNGRWGIYFEYFYMIINYCQSNKTSVVCELYKSFMTDFCMTDLAE